MDKTTLGLLLVLLATSPFVGCATGPKDGAQAGQPEASEPVASAQVADAPSGQAATGTAPLASNRYAVTAHRAPFYFYGPAQSSGPNLGLVKGTKVTMIHPDRLFSRVRTDHGHEGYIATDYLEQLPPEPVRSAISLADTSVPAFYHQIRRQPLPELEVVPLEMMLQLEEPPLPSGGVTPVSNDPATPAATETLIPTAPTTGADSTPTP